MRHSVLFALSAVLLVSSLLSGQVSADSIGPATGLKVADGFNVDLIYDVPKDQQGSWVAMTVDPKGRLITSDQYGQLYRVTLPSPKGPDQVLVEKIGAKVGAAQGLAYFHDSLYVVDSAKQQGVYRVRDTDGDDQFDKVEKLLTLKGGGEHGPHGIVPGPDGKLYLVAGNHTNLIDLQSSLVPRVWDEDHLLGRMLDARGHARGKKAPGGWVVRMNPDGSGVELFSSGYRNAYDIAFNAAGELFTYDSDMEWDMNTPWYRPTRINHVVPGSEFGWRSGTGKWPAYYPDSLPAVYNVGPGSPTGVTFGYGARFPEKYQKALFACDWSYGKLYALHLAPDGATYQAAEVEEFITATPLPLTDIVVNPADGAMYFLVGGRKTQSGLYRVTHDKSHDVIKPEAKLTDAAKLRRELESLYSKTAPSVVDQAWPHLNHADRFVRYAARIAVEHQPVESWQQRALDETRPHATITAMVALARTGDKSLQPKMLEALGRVSWASLNHQQKLELLRAYALTFIRMGRPDEATAKRLAEKFSPLYPANTPELNAELCQMVVYLDAPDAIEKTLKLMAEAPTQEEQMHYALCLRDVKKGWTIEQRREYFSWFIKASSYRGGASFRGFIDNIRKAAVKTLSDEEKKKLGELIEGKGEPAPAVAVEPREFVKAWTVEELAPKVQKNLTGRDFARGRKLFGAATCASCHRFNGEGGAVGPDLTGSAGRFSVKDLLESIIEPNKVISDQYETTLITLKDGNVVMGRIVNLKGNNLRVNTNMLNPGQFTNVNRDKVKKIEPAPISMMPPGLLNTLSEEEVYDLMAYLLSRGNPDHEMFKK